MADSRIRIEVFVPLGSCICDVAPFMEKVGHVASRFRDSVDLRTMSTESSEASAHGVKEMCVVVNGRMRLASNFDEKDLEKAILECN